MTALNRFGLDIAMDIVGAPMPLIEREVRFTAVEFCDYTLTWRVSLDDIDVVGGTGEYELTVPANSRVVTIVYAGHDGAKLMPTTEVALDDDHDGWRTSKSSKAAWYYLPDRTRIRIVLTPDAAGTLEAAVALAPTQDAKVLPDMLYNEHLESIRKGTLARMLAVPGKAWSNPAMAAYYLNAFDRAKRKEKAERLNDYTRRSTLSITPVNYTGRRSRDED